MTIIIRKCVTKGEKSMTNNEKKSVIWIEISMNTSEDSRVSD
jgi:hypothetical protein